MKHHLLLSVLLLVTCRSFSTPQVRDVLYWNGTTYHVYPFIDVEKKFSDTQLKKLNERVKDNTATSNWRGYYFEFEICHDSLFLVSIKGDHQEDLMAFVLGSNDRIMMDDFSDTLYLGYGKSFYDEEFPTMIYESEMTVVFKNGIAVWYEDHKNKSKHTELPHNIIKWNECIYSSIRWDALDQNILAGKPKAYVNFSTDSLGKVSNVTLLKSSGYPDFDKEAMRAVTALPVFSAHFVCGKYLKHEYRLPVVFDKSKVLNNENTRAELQKQYPALSEMIYKYYYTWYEYPNSANELISFFNETKEHWSKKSYNDSISATLTYLENENNNILWEYNTPRIDSISLVVIKDTDTLFSDFRIIDVSVSWYCLVNGFARSYLRYPSTLEELITYSGDEILIDSATKYAYDNLYNAYDFASAWVLRCLRNMESDCNWLGNDTELLVTNGNDTVVYFTGGVPVLCMSNFKSEIPMFWPRFYDSKGHVVWDEELEKEWKQRTVFGIRPVYPVLIKKEIYDNWYYFEYTREKGIRPYCESDTVDTNTPYFKDLEERMSRFAEEKSIGRIIFTAPTRM